MIQLNRFHVYAAFTVLAALRIAIGFHFFDQGHQKFQQGGFDSTGFLRAANGSFAPLYHSMIPDYDGKIRLCYNPDKKDPDDPEKLDKNKIDPTGTLAVWKSYKNYIIDELINEESRLVKSRKKLKDQIDAMEKDSEEYLVAVNQYQREEEVILAIRASRKYGSANRIYEDYKERLEDYLTAYEEDINFYFSTENRLDGFQRDYQSAEVDSDGVSGDRQRESRMKRAAQDVNLLREQVYSIASDRQKDAYEWLSVINGLWEGFESELLAMAPLDNATKARLALSKPYESTTIDFVNTYVPYFDVTVGVLLIVGLFTRVASLAAGGFLVSILMSQSAILGEAAAPTTILYLIETLAAFTVFATCAGRYAGLDFFIHAGWKRLVQSENEDFV